MDLTTKVAKVREAAQQVHAEALAARVSQDVDLDPVRLFERTSEALLTLLAIEEKLERRIQRAGWNLEAGSPRACVVVRT